LSASNVYGTAKSRSVAAQKAMAQGRCRSGGISTNPRSLHDERLDSRAHDRPSMGCNSDDMYAFGGLGSPVIATMSPIYVPLLSALAGAIIGSLSSIATILIQAKISDRRERLRQAASLAMEEFKIQIANTQGKVLPFSSFLHHHIAVIQAVEEGNLTPERLRQISAADDAITDVHIELDRAWAEKRRKQLLEKD
jgi:hypothetical protein